MKQQVEIKWDMPEPFALAIRTTLDGDRIAREAAQSAADKQEADKRQEEIRA